MKRILLVDGENFKGKIKQVFKEAEKIRPDWHHYDFRGLLDKVLTGMTFDRQVFYFAKRSEHSASTEKSRQLIEEQRLLKTHLERTGFEVVLSSRVRGQMERDHAGHEALTFKEKGVDVRIAVDMVSFACDGTVKELTLASSDSDLQPAIREIRKRQVSCVYLGFEMQPNKGLTYTTDRTILIRNAEVLAAGGPAAAPLPLSDV